MLEASRSMESLTAIPGVKLNTKARDVTIARLNYMQVRKLVRANQGSRRAIEACLRSNLPSST